MTMPRSIPVAGALLLACSLLLALAVNPLSARAAGEGLEDDGGAQWRLEPITPPPLPDGQRSTTPIGLGAIGDIEFWAPNHGNRGLLITAGNGNTIPPGLWAYNGQGWHELATVCGASDGRIAWAGPEEFWTISDGRPGQAANAQGDPAPIEDDTLCHFAGGAVVGSYASPAFQATSYQPMHAAGCISATDCWFAGDRLPEPLLGSFHLHWNGSSLEAKSYEGEAQPVEDMFPFEDRLYESVRVLNPERTSEEPPAVHLINPEGFNPTFESISNIPLYGPGEFPEALDYLRLSADSEALWGAAGPVPENEVPEGSVPAKVTVVRDAGGAWSQLLGPESPGEPFAGDIVTSIAAEPLASGTPGGDGAWVALDTPVDFEKPSPTARALVARISAGGTVSDEQTLPSASEEEAGVGPKGAAKEIACPAPHDCWLATTQGWLFHLSTESERRLPEDPGPAFANLITYRPPDEGLPQVLPDAPPADDSGLLGEPPTLSVPLPQPPTSPLESTTTVALLSHIRTRLVHGSTLELRFRLAVKARLRLLAKRRGHLVASTSMRTLAAGNRQLLLRLNPRRWPTKLALQTHALAPLPKVATSGPGGDNSNTVSTGLVVLPRTLSPAGSELLR